jgi:hypothetical protein
MMDPQVPTAYIVRRGHGRVEVHPSPVHVQPGGSFAIKNLLRGELETAVVVFDGRSREWVDRGQDIAPGGAASFTISKGAVPAFVEYQIRLKTGEWVVGGSSPGMIIDG